MSIRILIVDHHAMFRHDLEQYLGLLDADYEIVGEAATGEAAVQEIGHLRPDIVLLDIDLPDRNGLITTRYVRKKWPEIAVIAIAGYGEEVYRQAAFEAGATECVERLAIVEQLPAALAAASALRRRARDVGLDIPPDLPSFPVLP